MLERIEVDHLTGFLSRDLLNKFLQENMIEAASERKSLFITLLDLDRFKKFNDRFGHIFGDEILKYASEVMRSTFGETSNYFFRYGGDEFVVVSIDKKVSDIVRSIRKYNSQTYYKPTDPGSRLYRITFSAGIAVFPQDAQTVNDLIKKADKAMYFSKKHGRKTVTQVSNVLYRMLADIVTTIVVVVTGACLAGYLVYNNSYILRDTATNILDEIKRIKAVRAIKATTNTGVAETAGAVAIPETKPSSLDVVTLKSGIVREGRILVNSASEIIMIVNTSKGELIISIATENIEAIKRGTSVASNKKE